MLRKGGIVCVSLLPEISLLWEVVMWSRVNLQKKAPLGIGFRLEGQRAGLPPWLLRAQGVGEVGFYPESEGRSRGGFE